MNQVLWRNYLFNIYSFYAPWNDVGGVYIFSRYDYQHHLWVVLYVGETGSFRNRLPWHEKRLPAFLMGATNVIAMTAPAALRVAVEWALIQEFDPPLNKQLRPKPADLWQLLFPTPGFDLGR